MKINKELYRDIKKLIYEEYRNNKGFYYDKEEPMIGILNEKLVFYEGNGYVTTKIEESEK